jgi:hypothetical protein
MVNWVRLAVYFVLLFAAATIFFTVLGIVLPRM